MAIRPLPYVDEVALDHVATEIDVPADSLNKLIDFESRWDATAVNFKTGARGLIQFTNTTARSLGYDNADALVEANPTRADQLMGPVLQYLQRYAPYENDQALYLAVFYPDARTWSLDREFPENVQALNEPIRTVRDYIDFIEGNKTGPGLTLLLIAAVAGIAIYLFFS